MAKRFRIMRNGAEVFGEEQAEDNITSITVDGKETKIHGNDIVVELRAAWAPPPADTPVKDDPNVVLDRTTGQPLPTGEDEAPPKAPRRKPSAKKATAKSKASAKPRARKSSAKKSAAKAAQTAPASKLATS